MVKSREVKEIESDIKSVKGEIKSGKAELKRARREWNEFRDAGNKQAMHNLQGVIEQELRFIKADEERLRKLENKLAAAK